MCTSNANCPRGSVNLKRENARAFLTTKPIGSLAAALLTVFIVLIAATGSRAQVLYGSLVGNVTDQKDAAIPGARVEVTNVSTGETRSATTDDRGAYMLNDLQVGVYKIAISRAS